MTDRFRRWAQIVPIITLWLACLPAAAGAQDADGGLIIDVRAAETGRPLAGVDISITDRDGTELEGRTGADGSISFERLAPGLYDVTAAVAGRISVEEPSVRVSRRRVTALSTKSSSSPAVGSPTSLAPSVTRFLTARNCAAPSVPAAT